MAIQRYTHRDLREEIGKAAPYEDSVSPDLQLVKQMVKELTNIDHDPRGFFGGEDEVHPTLLQEACHYGHLQLAEILIDAGADVNARDRTGDGAGQTSVLQWATSCLGSYGYGTPEVVHLLLDSGAEPGLDNYNRYSSLHHTANHNYPDLAERLIQKGAKINARTPGSSRTPLHIAAKEGHSEIVSILLYHGAESDLRDDDLETPLDKALEAEEMDIVQTIKGEIQRG